MKKLFVFAICAFACYAMQAQCGGCPHHKQQTGCAKTTQTLKSDSTKATKAVPADGRAKISTQNVSTQRATIIKQKENTTAVENTKAIPVQKATIKEEENAKNKSAR